MHTAEADLRQHLEAADCPICKARGYSDVRIDFDRIDGVEDIVTEDDNHKLLSRLMQHIRRESRPEAAIYLGLVGGRRNMNVILTVASMLFPVAGLYDVVSQDTRLTGDTKRKRDAWQSLSEIDRKNIWDAEIAAWKEFGLQAETLDTPPCTFGWHYNVKTDFHIVRLPFIGLTPFLEGFIRLLRQRIVSTSGSAETQREMDWTERSISDMLLENREIADSINRFQQFFQTPIEEVTTPTLFLIEENDRRFWHDCIKHGTNNPDCTREKLRDAWEKLHKAFFGANKVADPLFDEFDALFVDETQPLETLKHKFKVLYGKLNAKICRTLQSRSRSMEEWLDPLTQSITTPTPPFRWHWKGSRARALSICTGAELDLILKDVLRNAVQHGTGQPSLHLTENALIIKNPGKLDRERWEKSRTYRDAQRICDDYHLKFTLSAEPDGETVQAVFSWCQPLLSNLPVNARAIVEGGAYGNAENTHR